MASLKHLLPIAFLAVSSAAFATGSFDAHPKITSRFEMPKPPKPSGDTGPFDGGTSTPRVVDAETKAKLEDLAKTYGKVARDNYQLILKSLELSPDSKIAPVEIVLTYGYDGVAATSGSGFGAGAESKGARIEVSAKYALAHPKDLGMIVHELTHVVQSYPAYDPVWLVEGIADYVRWFNYEEVGHRPHPKQGKATARDSYQTTGAFLYWATGKYNKDLVPKLNAALTANTYKESIWVDLTGKSLDDLNTEWQATLPLPN